MKLRHERARSGIRARDVLTEEQPHQEKLINPKELLRQEDWEASYAYIDEMVEEGNIPALLSIWANQMSIDHEKFLQGFNKFSTLWHQLGMEWDPKLHEELRKIRDDKDMLLSRLQARQAFPVRGLMLFGIEHGRLLRELQYRKRGDVQNTLNILFILKQFPETKPFSFDPKVKLTLTEGERQQFAQVLARKGVADAVSLLARLRIADPDFFSTLNTDALVAESKNEVDQLRGEPLEQFQFIFDLTILTAKKVSVDQTGKIVINNEPEHPLASPPPLPDRLVA